MRRQRQRGRGLLLLGLLVLFLAGLLLVGPGHAALHCEHSGADCAACQLATAVPAVDTPALAPARALPLPRRPVPPAPSRPEPRSAAAPRAPPSAA